MKHTCTLLAAAVLFSMPAFAADYNLGKLAGSGKLDLFNRTLDQMKAGGPDVLFLNSGNDYGLAWVSGIELSTGIIEVELRGRNEPGQSFVGTTGPEEGWARGLAAVLMAGSETRRSLRQRSESLTIKRPKSRWD